MASAQLITCLYYSEVYPFRCLGTPTDLPWPQTANTSSAKTIRPTLYGQTKGSKNTFKESVQSTALPTASIVCQDQELLPDCHTSHSRILPRGNTHFTDHSNDSLCRSKSLQAQAKSRTGQDRTSGCVNSQCLDHERQASFCQHWQHPHI